MRVREIHVFAGPSLPPALRPGDPRLMWHPPAAAGDLIALLDDPPEGVCLIDGFFDSCSAPWHKELLLLMARGSFMVGASSMGALRAAELDRFGMTGVGAIYRAYRNGLLKGDDEVALIHAPARLGWVPLTVPMVEVRATLNEAVKAGVFDGSAARAVRAAVHDIHFEDRDWPAMRRACLGLIGTDEFEWLRSRHVPLKQQDALACLDFALTTPMRARASISAPRTCFIDALAGHRPAASPGSDRELHPRR